MKTVVDIGLPDIDEDEIGTLTEECEREITNFILNEIPSKSIDDLSISCTLELEKELDLTIDIEIIQKYDTGHDLESIIEKALIYASEWLEARLKEMK